jgi:hypothetical protein
MLAKDPDARFGSMKLVDEAIAATPEGA